MTITPASRQRGTAKKSALSPFTFGRRAVLASALVMLSTVTGCAAGTAATSQAAVLLSQQAAPRGTDVMAAARLAAAARLLQQMRSTAGQAQRMDELARLTASQHGVKQTTTKIHSQLRQVPRKPTTEMARVAGQLRLAQRRLNEIHGIQRAADRAVGSLPAGGQQISRDATSKAAFYLTPRETSKLRQTLARKAQEQALELGCDALWDGLTQRDKDTALDAYNDGLVVSTYTVRISAPTGQAVVDDAYQAVLGAFGTTAGPRASKAIAWGTYAQGVLAKARVLQQNDWQALTEITASGHTTALIHYARVCLRPPR